MTHFLDTLPFDWTRPEAQELHKLLSHTYYREDRVVAFANQTGISPAVLPWNQPMWTVWRELMTKARDQNRLRELLRQVEASGDEAVAIRVREFLGPSPVVAATASPTRANPWHGFDDHGALELLLSDEYTLLDVAFLQRGLELSAAVARLRVTLPTGKYHGSAFRISDDLLLTNHHVLYDDNAGDAPATEVEAWFGYELDFAGRSREHHVVACEPASITGDKLHDWAVIRMAAPPPEGTPVIDLTGARPVKADDRVYIIQHPNGGVKKIGMHHNIVRHVDDDVVQYLTDTENGSSGSPVFDERWQVVALHHRWVTAGNGATQEYRNQGRRIGRVLEGLTAAGLV